jgi:hypothetical protein
VSGRPEKGEGEYTPSRGRSQAGAPSYSNAAQLCGPALRAVTMASARLRTKSREDAEFSNTPRSTFQISKSLRSICTIPFSPTVVEGSIPNEKIKEEGYWAALGTGDTPLQTRSICAHSGLFGSVDRGPALAPKNTCELQAQPCCNVLGEGAFSGSSQEQSVSGVTGGWSFEQTATASSKRSRLNQRRTAAPAREVNLAVAFDRPRRTNLRASDLVIQRVCDAEVMKER